MRNYSISGSLNASLLPRAILKTLVCCLVAGGASMFAQITVISADNLSPFEPRDVGMTSDAKTVRIKLNYARAISSIAVAPGNTEFTAGSVTGCVVDGHTINPALSACSLDVTFSPKYPGLRTAPLVMTDGAGTKSSVGLVGTGLGPQAALTPGIITTVAGNGTYGFSPDGGPATEVSLATPYYVAFDQEGNFYISDLNHSRVRKVDRNGIITTVAGNGSFTYSGDNGPATSAGLHPYGITLDAAGNLYIADDGVRVRKVDVNGIITTFAGNGSSQGPCSGGDGGPATQARLCPFGLATDDSGNVYITGNPVRKVDTKGIISTVAGGGTSPGGYGGDGGPATEATLGCPYDVATDATGNLYIADVCEARIRKVDTNGIITTVAGNGNWGFSGDGGRATQAEFYEPFAVAVDAAGNVYIADQGNYRVRRVDTNGTIKTIAGNGTDIGSYGSYSGDGGPATAAGLSTMYGIAIDSSGGLYVADGDNKRVRKVDVSKSAVDFASHLVGTTSPSREVVVTNTGNQHIEFTGLSLTGDFGQLTGKARDCTDTTFLGAGFSCAIRITFAPTAAGTLKGSATVTDNSLSLPGTTQTIALSGTGVTP